MNKKNIFQMYNNVMHKYTFLLKYCAFICYTNKPNETTTDRVEIGRFLINLINNDHFSNEH